METLQDFNKIYPSTIYMQLELHIISLSHFRFLLIF